MRVVGFLLAACLVACVSAQELFVRPNNGDCVVQAASVDTSLFPSDFYVEGTSSTESTGFTKVCSCDASMMVCPYALRSGGCTFRLPDVTRPARRGPREWGHSRRSPGMHDPLQTARAGGVSRMVVPVRPVARPSSCSLETRGREIALSNPQSAQNTPHFGRMHSQTGCALKAPPLRFLLCSSASTSRPLFLSHAAA